MLEEFYKNTFKKIMIKTCYFFLHKWKILPSIAFVRDRGPVVLT